MPSKDKPHHEPKKPKAQPAHPHKAPTAGSLPLSSSDPVAHLRKPRAAGGS